jgi:leucine-rich repeat transmembrane neuronal protein 1/2
MKSVVCFSIEAVATISFSEAQYIMVTLPQESYTEAEDISLRFRTVRSSGLLLVTSSSTSEDAIELYLERGACKLSISLGRGTKVSYLYTSKVIF